MTGLALAYVWLVATPTALCAAAGAILGFPLQGALLGLGTGAALAGAKWLAQLDRVRDLEAALLPAGGALGAALVTLLFGATYLPQLAAAAVFGWGAGVAAVVFVAIQRPGVWWRTTLAVLSAVAVAYLLHAMSLMQLVSRLGLGFAASVTVLMLGIELSRALIRSERRWVALALSAAAGVGAGIVYGLVGQWWYDFGLWLGWRASGSALLTSVIVGAVIAAACAFFTRLSEIVTPLLRRAWQQALYFVGASVLLGTAISLLIGKVDILSLAKDTRVDETFLVIVLVAIVLVPSYFIRTRVQGLARRAAITLATWVSVGLVWFGPWPHAAAGFIEPTAARSLAAMIPWKISLDEADTARPRLVHFTRAPPRFRSARWPRVFVAPENAPLVKSFRCVKLALGHGGETQNRLGVRSPCVLFLAPDGREIDRFTGG